MAVVLAGEMKSLLIGESASASAQQAIVAALEDGPEVERVIHLRTVHIDPESLLVAAKIAIPPSSTAAQIVAGINAAERRVRTAVPAAQVIYLEPDIYRADLADEADPSVRAAHGRSPRRTEPPTGPATRPEAAGAARCAGQQAQGAFLLEVQRAGRRRWIRPMRRPRSATSARTAGRPAPGSRTTAPPG